MWTQEAINTLNFVDQDGIGVFSSLGPGEAQVSEIYLKVHFSYFHLSFTLKK